MPSQEKKRRINALTRQLKWRQIHGKKEYMRENKIILRQASIEYRNVFWEILFEINFFFLEVVFFVYLSDFACHFIMIHKKFFFSRKNFGIWNWSWILNVKCQKFLELEASYGYQRKNFYDNGYKKFIEAQLKKILLKFQTFMLWQGLLIPEFQFILQTLPFTSERELLAIDNNLLEFICWFFFYLFSILVLLALEILIWNLSFDCGS